MGQADTHPVVAESNRLRDEATRENYTIPEAINDAEWVRRTPDAVITPERAKQMIVTLLSALEASPCYLKGAKQNVPTFTLLAYDKAGHFAMVTWADVAESHGCRPEKVADARAKLLEWAARPDCKWPD